MSTRVRRASRPHAVAHGSTVEKTVLPGPGPGPGPSESPPLPRRRVSLKDRIVCHRWTWFTLTMSTGGIANILYTLPYRPDWISYLGSFFVIFNLCLFSVNIALSIMRFCFDRGSFRQSFTDQQECLFIPSFFVSIAVILINISEYGIGRFAFCSPRAMEIMFWLYTALGTFASAAIYLTFWSTQVFPLQNMTPTWVFPAYPLLLTAPFAAQLIMATSAKGDIRSISGTAIAVCAVTAQGTGCLIAFMISSAFIYRLMTKKLPIDIQRPGVFMSVGPFAFTAAGMAQLGSVAEYVIEPGFIGAPHVVELVKVMSTLVALWLWGLSWWFCLVSVGAFWKYVRPRSRLSFQMTWWSFVFPNTALVTATGAMGEVFNNDGIRTFTVVMTVIVVIVYIFVFVAMLYNLYQNKLLYPTKDQQQDP